MKFRKLATLKIFREMGAENDVLRVRVAVIIDGKRIMNLTHTDLETSEAYGVAALLDAALAVIKREYPSALSD